MRRTAFASFASVAERPRKNLRKVQAHRHSRDERPGRLRFWRARYCEPKITSFTKTDGLTFRVKEILDGVFKGKSFLARHIPREGAEVIHEAGAENVKHLKEVVPQGVG